MAPGQSSSASSPHSLTAPPPSAFCSGSGTAAAASMPSAGNLLSARTCQGLRMCRGFKEETSSVCPGQHQCSNGAHEWCLDTFKLERQRFWATPATAG